MQKLWSENEVESLNRSFLITGLDLQIETQINFFASLSVAGGGQGVSFLSGCARLRR